jgi:hypothetical protein
MKISNYENYTIFCIHNFVMNFIVSVQGNELLVANIVSLLNSSRDACIDYHYCLSDKFKYPRYYELDSNKSEDIDFISMHISSQG